MRSFSSSLLRRLSVTFLVLWGLVSPIVAQGSADQVRLRTEPWPAAVLEAAARIPVQEEGRIKPLDTFASFQMLRLHGMRSFKTEWDEKLTPVAWFLDCLFFPEQAMHYKVVRVDDTHVVRAIGGSVEGKNRRDRFSMAELDNSLGELDKQARVFLGKAADERTPLEVETINLSRTLPQLRFLIGTMDFARERFQTAELPGMEDAFPQRSEVRFLDLVSKFTVLAPVLEKPAPEIKDRVRGLLDRVWMTQQLGKYFHFLPPTDATDEDYLCPFDVLRGLSSGRNVDPAGLASMRQLEELTDFRGDFSKFTPEFVAFSGDLVQRATERGEFDKIDLEVSFYKWKWFDLAFYGFFASFLSCLVFLVAPRLRAAYLAAVAAAGIGEVLLITGIVIRCVIRSRPPVTTPYEAILFILSVGVAVWLFVEWTRRTGLGVILAASTGVLGIWLAWWHEGTEAADTMQPLVAVLDTNFWLSTHVTTVTLGYCAGALAALISHLYIFAKLYEVGGRAIGKTVDLTNFCSDLARITYGVLCFGLLFSTVGTILGGVWANDSWGRFWGWDPKENGALMLVLAFILVLHARMGGYLRQFGMAIASVVVGIIVMWAFWGVNLYNIGLHSYGFTEDKKYATLLYYSVEWSVVALGILTWALHRIVRPPQISSAV